MKPMTIEEARKVATNVSVRVAREKYLDSHARYFVQNSDKAQHASLIRVVPLCDYASKECMSKLNIQNITCSSTFGKPKRRDILLSKEECKVLLENLQAILGADEAFLEAFGDELSEEI